MGYPSFHPPLKYSDAHHGPLLPSQKSKSIPTDRVRHLEHGPHIIFIHTSCDGGRMTLTEMNSHRKSESMVLSWRSGVHHHRLSYGHSHGTGPGFPILRPSTQEVRAIDAVVLYDGHLSHYLPVVFLGLLPGLLLHRRQRIHRKLETLRDDLHHGCTISRQPADP